MTDELVQQVAEHLRDRYGLDDEDIRALGSVSPAHAECAAQTWSSPSVSPARTRETFQRIAE
jgi:hypothetical protein